MHAQDKLLTLLQKISLATAQAQEIDQAFFSVLSEICGFMDWPLGHAYVWSEADEALVSSGIWYVAPGYHFDAFRRLSAQTRFRPGQGTVGQVMAGGEAVTIPDLRGVQSFVRELPGAGDGVRAYFAFPVKVEKRVLAVLEFFARRSGATREEMTVVIHHAGSLLGMAMQKARAVRELRRSEELLAEAQRITHVAHWEWDLRSDDVTWSAELYRIIGFSDEASAPTLEAYLGHVHADDRAYVAGTVRAAIEKGQSFDHFHRIQRPDGAVRLLHSRGRPTLDQQGNPVRLYGTVQDITEIREKERELAQKVRQLSAVMDIGQAVASTLDLQGVCASVVSRLQPLLGARSLLLMLREEEKLRVIASNKVGPTGAAGRFLPADALVAADALDSRQPIRLEGEACRQRLSPELREWIGYQPEVVVAAPLCVYDDCLGVLLVAHDERDFLGAEQLQLLQTSALWTAIGVQNARQYDRLQRRLDESEAILTISNAVVEAQDLQDLLQLILDNALAVVGHADWAAIHLLSPDADELELVGSAGLSLRPEEYLLPVGAGLAGEVVATGETTSVADMQADPRCLPVDRRMNARSLLVAPVESRERRLGTITVQCDAPNALSSRDARWLTILGIQAGHVINTAQLYGQQRRARQRAERQAQIIRRLARRLVQAQEDERAQIARELHDDVGQSLTALAISLELCGAQLPGALASVKADLRETAILAEQALDKLRRLSHNLRPPGLDVYGLDAALRGLCHDYARHTSLSIAYSGEEIAQLAPDVALALYRVAQEALTNAAKHAGARHVQVQFGRQGDALRLEIEDDGQGFVPPDWETSIPISGTGLVGMLERVEMVGGHLRVHSGPGEGTILAATVPAPQETV